MPISTCQQTVTPSGMRVGRISSRRIAAAQSNDAPGSGVIALQLHHGFRPTTRAKRVQSTTTRQRSPRSARRRSPPPARSTGTPAEMPSRHRSGAKWLDRPSAETAGDQARASLLRPPAMPRSARPQRRVRASKSSATTRSGQDCRCRANTRVTADDPGRRQLRRHQILFEWIRAARLAAPAARPSTRTPTRAAPTPEPRPARLIRRSSATEASARSRARILTIGRLLDRACA